MRVVITAFVVALALCGQARAQAGTPVIVFAAASLKTALDEAARAFARDHARPAPSLSYAGTPALARQIEQGAPADLFLSADADWMDYLAARGLLRPGSRRDLFGNALVLIAPRNGAGAVALDRPDDLAQALAGGRLAIADANTVPAGRYGRAALAKLGLWDAVKARLAQTENVRAALLFVSRGEAPLGVVYRTDAAADPAVRVVATFPADSHPPIVYPGAVTRASANPDADHFLEYLASDAARPIFERQGFSTRAGTP